AERKEDERAEELGQGCSEDWCHAEWLTDLRSARCSASEVSKAATAGSTGQPRAAQVARNSAGHQLSWAVRPDAFQLSQPSSTFDQQRSPWRSASVWLGMSATYHCRPIRACSTSSAQS